MNANKELPPPLIEQANSVILETKTSLSGTPDWTYGDVTGFQRLHSKLGYMS